MSRITAVVHEDLGMGFGLAGVAVMQCATSEEAMNAVQMLVQDREQGIIVIEEEFFDGVDPRVKEMLLKRTVPLVLPVPGTLVWHDTEEVPRDDLVARLIRQAVGYQLNIQY